MKPTQTQASKTIKHITSNNNYRQPKLGKSDNQQAQLSWVRTRAKMQQTDGSQ